MKKKMIVAAFVVAMVAWYSCAKTESATAPSADADTTAVEVVEAAPAEEDRSEEIRNRVTYDLAFYELHGPVQMLKEEYHTVTFNQQGKLVSLDGYNPFTVNVSQMDPQNPKIKFTRDSKGRIVKQEGWEYLEEYKWDGMRLASSRWDGEGMWGECTFIYNADGYVTSIRSAEGDYDTPPSSTTTSQITYIDFDEYGNWTARKANGNTERRIIKYYPVQ